MNKIFIEYKLNVILTGGCSSEGNSGRRRNNNTNHSSSGSKNYPDIVPNMRGHYTLCYPRFKESDDATKEVNIIVGYSVQSKTGKYYC
jgi:hypothetical protein